ncbi:MAG: hypothetical protein Q9201_002737 [Fulgogasparrea decipioides]
MNIFHDCWLVLLGFFNAITLLPGDNVPHSQQILQPMIGPLHPHAGNDGPVFTPPSHPQNPRAVLECDYSPMGNQWQPCSTNHSRACWLAGPDGQEYNIKTDYETQIPTGVTRNYTLDADEMNITADGILMPYGKVFNQQYPGPWIQITVKNNLRFNGTSVHWHGIRQLQSLEMDGVPGVTQCPIAPGESYTYRFRATQYGTSWYHSHYSLQYGDGLAGPLTIHGPSSSNYDEPQDPILMTDWNHRSAFQDFQVELEGGRPVMYSILLNGQATLAARGKGSSTIPRSREYDKFSLSLGNDAEGCRQGKRYLLRLINTSVDTTFVFALDNHNITVMSSDFVPINPYVTDHVTIGAGQRYHVVIEASPKNLDGTPNLSEAFWMRTIPATGCHSFQRGGIPDERQGIVYYKSGSTSYPFTAREKFSIDCNDEPYDKLQPVVPWKVPIPANTDHVLHQDLFDVGIDKPVPGHPLPNDSFFRWAIGPRNLYVNFSEPTVLNLHNEQWNPNYVVIPKDYPEGGWVYLIIYGNATGVPPRARRFRPAAHPVSLEGQATFVSGTCSLYLQIHLHGHDFVLLQQSNQTYNSTPLALKFDNPPRRDVVLLPSNGTIVIAFKADNPGSWLVHCHIAWHASSGLAMQILERQEDLQKQISPTKAKPVIDGCASWDKWFSDPNNLWNSTDIRAFQDDSGI